MPKPVIKHLSLSVCCAVLMAVTHGLVSASTTGSLSGTVTLSSGASGLANAVVTAASTSQTLTTNTDGKGRFIFLSLAPDTYTLSVEKQGYDPLVFSGVSVFADQMQTLALKLHPIMREIGHVGTHAEGDIVKPGMTADVYSFDPTLVQKAQVLGGGGAMNQVYSGVAAAPGVVIPPGQNGWNQAIYVRGSNFDQTGYEYDGVPMNRAFDNYTAYTGSSLGLQELQVYTGGGPAGITATGLGGFINQVIRRGAYPGFADVQITAGAPAYYHALQAEVGGGSPDRNFTYFLGFSGSGQDFRYVNQFNGAGNPALAAPLSLPAAFGTGVAPPCKSGAIGFAFNCYYFAPSALELQSNVSDREVVGNFHFSLPHHTDAGKDDVQLLYANSAMGSFFADSVNDLIADGALAPGSSLPYTSGTVFPNGTQFGQSAAGLSAAPYGFPSAFVGDTNINPFRRDGVLNDAAVVKLQYQKNFGTKAYARVYGYTLYSDWLMNAAVSTSATMSSATPFFPTVPVVPDYELSTHTRGVQLQVADQITPEHVLQFTGNYAAASSTRWNNNTMFNTPSTSATNLVDAAGNCYDSAGQLGTCNKNAADKTYGTFGNPTPFAPPAGSPAALAGAQWLVTNPGQTGSINTVAPRFSSFALTDAWHPSERWNVDAGLRFERFQYDLASMNTPGQNFWASAAQKEICYDPASMAFMGFALSCAGTAVHPNGQNGAILYTNNVPATFAPTVLEPRLGATFTLDPDTVLRASYGRYAEPANTASIQYAAFQPNTPAAFFAKFSVAGLAASPFHAIQPAVSSNYDLSLEKHFRGTDMSVKLTPFYKHTLNELQNVYLDQAQQFVSAINAGTQRSEGVEFQFSKGDFKKDGLSLLLSYTYTDTRIKYQNIGNSSSNPVDQINASIKQYNAFTAAGGGAPCYTPATANSPGAPLASCAGSPSAIQNPYYNQSPQNLLDRGAWYVPFEYTPAVNDVTPVSYLIPHVASLVLNYKRGSLAITPSLQMFAGQRYGAPLSQIGWNPASCAGNQQGIPSAVAAGRGQYADWTTCNASLNIPNYETGVFDGQGAYTEPTDLQANLQISYDLSRSTKVRLTFANLLSRCFGGSKEPWTVGGAGVCGYGLDQFGGGQGVSNFYNGASPYDAAANNGATALPYNAHAYTAQAGGNPPLPAAAPLQMYLSAEFKI